MKKSILLLGLVLFLTSCAQWFGFHGSRMVRISPGMSKAEVIQELGSPRGVGGHDNIQILYYQEDMGSWQWSYYYVRLVDGKVESYGKGQVTQ